MKVTEIFDVTVQVHLDKKTLGNPFNFNTLFTGFPNSKDILHAMYFKAEEDGVSRVLLSDLEKVISEMGDLPRLGQVDLETGSVRIRKVPLFSP